MQLYLLIIGLLITNITHLLSAKNTLRQSLISQFGKRLYFSIYGLTSTLGLLFIIYGYSDRDFIDIYTPTLWMMHLNKAIMFFALWLMVSQFFKTYVKYYVKIPLILAVLLWSSGHLCANGDLYSIILFGGFMAYAIIGIYIKLTHKFEPIKPKFINDITAIICASILYLFIAYLHYWLAGIQVFTH